MSEDIKKNEGLMEKFRKKLESQESLITSLQDQLNLKESKMNEALEQILEEPALVGSFVGSEAEEGFQPFDMDFQRRFSERR